MEHGAHKVSVLSELIKANFMYPCLGNNLSARNLICNLTFSFHSHASVLLNSLLGFLLKLLVGDEI